MAKKSEPQKVLRELFAAAVAAAAPDAVIGKHMPKKPNGRVIVIGAGKASAAMAHSFEKRWKGKLEGLVVTRYGHGMPCKQIEIVEASHPVPDDKGLHAAERILKMVEGLSKDDLVLALISGGGSALLSLPMDGISPEEKRNVNKALLASGAPIAEMNCVRKHLSKIKGGRLAAAAYPAKVLSLVISDVQGDDLSSVASGPTVADPTTFRDALAIIQKYNINIPSSVMQHLTKAKNETPKRLKNVESKLIASPQRSLLAAAKLARQHGYTPIILGDAIEGEAREVGIALAGIALQAKRFGQPVKPPCAIISGGETTVTVRGKGVGGRNVECLLSLALKLNGTAGIYAIMADTDGIDGGAEVAGAIITPKILEQARALGLDANAALQDNDAHTFFKLLNAQVVTGPTLTNVNDFRCVLVD